MKFEQLDKHIISMTEFNLKWRFTEEKYDYLPEQHLNELKPLDNTGAEFLAEFLSDYKVHNEMPFKNGMFRNLDKAKIFENNEKEITKWLYQRAIPFDKEVFLSWDGNNGMITKWKFVVKYWNSLFYGGADDLTIFDQSLQWVLLFHHEEEIYFGTNKNYEPNTEFEEKWFVN
ncbi:DUF2947 family protein [Tenacibaculum finnmarkense]|uniref:DUF2947 family protein n=1 Tax=Tenacibaculum finnmarkense TaxID=2781243 RepID=UPI001E45F609|nr:DUF2947 family protein [Tenacibaculum finnmarkense]MCD8413640.1 DUF2947 family protein [Tenacibaculum finnmarkense genomovar ulcerans]MCG8208402.1 hypothetical protein [Tenacibaculum finnmarkense genomovar finnmarkense]MCG8724354.1 hypothetical protein [Tenacibaculum finnmarkense]MCG8742668.1 hypothetical protein [Tenacibaculum finnmarkense]MCG8766082.1 hypothetical protein [Tenacibaculum finnmarkense]